MVSYFKQSCSLHDTDQHRRSIFWLFLWLIVYRNKLTYTHDIENSFFPSEKGLWVRFRELMHEVYMRTGDVWSLNPLMWGFGAQSVGKAEAVMMSLLKSMSLAACPQPEHTGQPLTVHVLPQQLPEGTWSSALKTCQATGLAAQPPLPAQWSRCAPKSLQTFLCKMICTDRVWLLNSFCKSGPKEGAKDSFECGDSWWALLKCLLDKWMDMLLQACHPQLAGTRIFTLPWWEISGDRKICSFWSCGLEKCSRH